jgi:hypothetical protein
LISKMMDGVDIFQRKEGQKVTRIRACIFVLLALLLSCPAGTMAAPVRIYDSYVGADSHGYGDRIGDARFEVEWMDIEIVGSSLNVAIRTNFQGNSGYPNLTVNFGDLFVSTDGWHPYGSAPYASDNYSNGEQWEYVFDVSAGKLYPIANGEILRTENLMPSSGWIYRNGQESLVKDQTGGAIGQGGSAYYSPTYYSSSSGAYVISFDINGLGWKLEDLGFRWTMTCGNDVIEGAADPVSEPTTMLILGTGLIGLAGFGRKLKPKG